MKNIALIGSTGSIGRQTLNVVRRHPDKFNIVSLAAGNNSRLFAEQVKEFHPLTATACFAPEGELVPGVEYYFGEEAFINAVTEKADIVVVALVGFKGVAAVLKAVEMKKDIALANKESLVAGGSLVTWLAQKNGVKIIPVDSEHSAIFQALGFDMKKSFRRIILTASGGAFRDMGEKELKKVTAADALKHPNWNMGAKITVDCATLVNKAFEVIEAKWLYNTDFDKIDVIIHRESIIHSMVEFNDGSVIAQLSYPSMEIPITLALTYPERIETGVKSLDFKALGALTFEEPDKKRFPCMDLVIAAAKKGGLYPAVANGANESAVRLFLQEKIGFGDIYAAISGALEAFPGGGSDDYEGLLYADRFAAEYVSKRFGV